MLGLRKRSLQVLFAFMMCFPVFGVCLSAMANSDTEMLSRQLRIQISYLDQAETELRKLKLTRTEWVLASLSTDAASVVAAVSGLVLAQDSATRSWSGANRSPKSALIPVILLGSAVSVVASDGSVQTYQLVKLRVKDIRSLLEKISKKKSDLDFALESLSVDGGNQ